MAPKKGKKTAKPKKVVKKVSLTTKTVPQLKKMAVRLGIKTTTKKDGKTVPKKKLGLVRAISMKKH
jgi:hypothetical protein